MAPTSSNSAQTTGISANAQRILLQVVQQSIRHGLDQGSEIHPRPEAYPAPLRAIGASFVTLHLHGELRGCIGTLTPHQPLVVDVAHNAYAAAFRDPRFAPLTNPEYEGLQIHISVLNPAEEIQVASEDELLARLRPGIDGLILEDGSHRGTFLPSVWQQLPEPADFLSHLKRKAGLPTDHWTKTLRLWRYTTTTFPSQAEE